MIYDIFSEPASSLGFITAPPTSVTANTPFDISVEIRDRDNNRITSGIDSTLPLTLQVAFFDGLVEHYSSVPFEDMVSKVHVSKV